MDNSEIELLKKKSLELEFTLTHSEVLMKYINHHLVQPEYENLSDSDKNTVLDIKLLSGNISRESLDAQIKETESYFKRKKIISESYKLKTEDFNSFSELEDLVVFFKFFGILYYQDDYSYFFEKEKSSNEKINILNDLISKISKKILSYKKVLNRLHYLMIINNDFYFPKEYHYLELDVRLAANGINKNIFYKYMGDYISDLKLKGVAPTDLYLVPNWLPTFTSFHQWIEYQIDYVWSK